MSKLLIPKTEQEAFELLCIDGEQPTERDINKAYRKLSRFYHSDKGGDDEDMKALNRAKELLIGKLERSKEQNEKQESERQRREKEQRKKQESERQRGEEEQRKKQESERQRGEEEQRKKQESEKQRREKEQRKKQESERQRKKQESEKQRTRGEISFELIEALKNRNLVLAEELIKEVRSFNTDLSGEFVYRFTCNACKSDDWFKFFQEFLQNQSSKIDLDTGYQSSFGTALNYACFKESQNVIELLLEHKADVNKISGHFNKAPIQFATAAENIEIVKLLLRNGADPYLGDPNAMQIATRANNAELVTLFHQHLNSKLCQAFENQDLEKVKELVKKVGNVSTCFNSDPTPLGCLVKNACEHNDWFKFFKEILSEQDSKIDLNIDIDPSGTALHYACNQENKNVIELLLKHKADVNKVGGSDNQLPIYSLLMRNNNELTDLLCESGAIIASIIPEVEKAISGGSWYSKYNNETMKVIVKGAGSAEYRTRILKSFFNNKTLTARDIEIVEFLLSRYQNIDLHLDLMQTAINKGNNKLIGSFDQILDLRLSENLMHERFEKAKELIRKLKDFNKYEVKRHDFGHADGVLLLYYLVKKACISDDWFKFFKEILSEQDSKIDLNIDIDPSGTALHYACNQENKNVIELLLKHGAANSHLGSPNAIFQSQQHIKENPSKESQNDEQASQPEVLPAVSNGNPNNIAVTNKNVKMPVLGQKSDTESNGKQSTNPNNGGVTTASVQSDEPEIVDKNSGKKDTPPKPPVVPLVASKDSERVNNAQGNSKQPSYPDKNNPAPQNARSKWPVVAASTLTMVGVVSGVAIAVYLEMLAVGIAVGACCLVAAAIIYCCRPKSSIENNKVEKSFSIEKEENVGIT